MVKDKAIAKTIRNPLRGFRYLPRLKKVTIFERDYFVKRGGKRYELIGRTRARRFLTLFMEKEKDKFKLITARDATKMHISLNPNSALLGEHLHTARNQS